MKHLLIVVACLAQIAWTSSAQITIVPAGGSAETRAAPPSPKIQDLPRLIEQLKSDREWWRAYLHLVKLAEGDYESEVIEATVGLWRACEDEAVRERTFLVPSRLNRRTHFRQRREALDEEIAGIARLSARLDREIKKLGAAGAAVEDLRTTAEEIGLKIARLQKTIANLDQQDPEFGVPSEFTIEMGGDLGDDEVELAEPPVDLPSTRPSDKKAEEPRDDRSARDDDRARRSGDLRRVDWVRPFKDAMAKARETDRVLLVKPLMGGSNVPDETGIPCGGKRDCEGSW